MRTLRKSRIAFCTGRVSQVYRRGLGWGKGKKKTQKIGLARAYQSLTLFLVERTEGSRGRGRLRTGRRHRATMGGRLEAQIRRGRYEVRKRWPLGGRSGRRWLWWWCSPELRPGPRPCDVLLTRRRLGVDIGRHRGRLRGVGSKAAAAAGLLRRRGILDVHPGIDCLRWGLWLLAWLGLALSCFACWLARDAPVRTLG